MSLSRLMLRALTINALMPQPGDPDLITLADDLVFDTMLDPKQFTKTKHDIPCIVVYTDDDEAQLINIAGGDGPYRRTVHLRVEIAIGTMTEIVEGKNRYQAFGVPSTDAELETKLDFFEQQVRWALFGWQRPATAAFQQYVVRARGLSSHAQRDEQANNKLALRRLNIPCEIPDDCPPAYGMVGDAPDMFSEPTRFTEDHFKVLPGWLRQMTTSMQDAPSMRAVLETLAGTGKQAGSFNGFKRLGVNVDYISPAADPTLLQRLGRTQGPDGRLEYRAVWNIQN